VLVGFSTKSYLSHRDVMEWLDAAATPDTAGVTRFVVPSAPSLREAKEKAGNRFLIGAQNCSTHPSGPHTGEISAEYLAGIGVDFVELGHAEQRRRGDTSETVARKVGQAQLHALDVLLCVGEEENLSPESAAAHCVRQIESSGADPTRLVIAYEPVWAIGAAEAAPARHVIDTVTAIRQHLAGWTTPIIYGGAAGAGLLEQLYPTLEGIFLGRRAHDPSVFNRVVEEAGSLSRA